MKINSDEELLREIEVADALLGLSLTPELIQRAKRLRWVQSGGVGSEKRLFPEFLASDIVLTNARGTTGINISEHVFALILAFARSLHMTRLRQMEKVWERPQNLSVIEIAGETIGIVGLGGIGLKVAKLGVGQEFPGLDLPVVGESIDGDFYGSVRLRHFSQLSFFRFSSAVSSAFLIAFFARTPARCLRCSAVA